MGDAEMKPYYEDDAVQIFHADCRELLPELSADLVLTDPPYGIGIANNPFRQKHERSDWDDSPVDNELLALAISRCSDAVVWGGNYFDLPPSQGFLIWDKVQPESFSSAMCEMAWMSQQSPAKIFQRHVVSYKKTHPTQKPIELMRWCIEKFPDAQTILDPFMGSGTTLRAAKDLNRRAIGIEIEEKYCEIAAKRMAQTVMAL
jgi:site-specific DNA-methyltransferase (adenine-specific)